MGRPKREKSVIMEMERALISMARYVGKNPETVPGEKLRALGSLSGNYRKLLILQQTRKEVKDQLEEGESGFHDSLYDDE